MTETFVVTGQERPHEEIIAMPFDQIFASYGKVKWLEVIREHFLIEINAFRKNLGNNEVSFSSGINDIAQEYAESIAKNGNFSHVDEDWKDVSDRADEKWITYTIISENISYNQKTIKDIIKGYKNWEKTGHFNVFKKPYTKIWFWVAKSAKGVFFSVCNYAN